MTVTKGKNKACKIIYDTLGEEYSKIKINKKIDIRLLKELFFIKHPYQVVFTIEAKEKDIYDTSILKKIYPIEQYDIKFVSFDNLLILKKNFQEISEFIVNKASKIETHYINFDHEKSKLSFTPNIDKLFVLTQKAPILNEMISNKNFIFYIYNSIEGYFLKENLLEKINDYLNSDLKLDIKDKLKVIDCESDTKKIYKEIALLISNDYHTVLRYTKMMLRDNDKYRIELDKSIKEII